MFIFSTSDEKKFTRNTWRRGENLLDEIFFEFDIFTSPSSECVVSLGSRNRQLRLHFVHVQINTQAIFISN